VIAACRNKEPVHFTEKSWLKVQFADFLILGRFDILYMFLSVVLSSGLWCFGWCCSPLDDLQRRPLPGTGGRVYRKKRCSAVRYPVRNPSGRALVRYFWRRGKGER
jgi:hypothetical protein